MNPQRFLVAAGLGSRRACDALIKAGRVTLNGRALSFGADVQPGDDVRVDGAPVHPAAAPVYVMLNKPAGYISDRGSRVHPSALDLVSLPEPAPGLHAVGRLDQDATGLLILTNDGELSYRLTHPSFEHEKEYRVWVEGAPDPADLARWRAGVMLPGEATPTAPAVVDIVHGAETRASTALRVVLHEGRKRQIKRVAKAIGHPVVALRRVRVGPLRLGELDLGEWRRLTDDEIALLKHESSRKPHRSAPAHRH